MLALFAFVSFPARSELESGNHLVLRAKLLGCGESEYTVDYVEIPDNGTIEVLDGIELTVIGLSEEEVRRQLLMVIAEKTGRTPKTLKVQLVSGDELADVAQEMMVLATSGPRCTHPVEQNPLRPDPEFIRNLAATPPNKSLHWSPGRSCHGSCNVYTQWKATAAPATGASELNR